MSWAWTYKYDPDDRRFNVAGSFARTGIPTAQTFSYKVDNSLSTFGTSTVSNDKNGNITCLYSGLCSTGYGTFSWDPRGHLQQAVGGSPTLQVTQDAGYDAFGRRISLATYTGSAGPIVVTYLYDGLNPVQETSSLTGLSTNLLVGLDLDDNFMSSFVGDNESFLTDPLNSVVATTNSSGVVDGTCTYEPYGYSPQGCDFTGRENDGDGLIFMRNRYYAPELGRFISRDPSGVAGGVNIYEYAGDDPTNFTDPLGLETTFGNGAFPSAFGEGLAYGVFQGFGGGAGGFQGPGGIGWPGRTLLVSQGGLGSDIMPIYQGQNGGGLRGPRIITRQILTLPLTLREEIIGQIKRLLGKSVEEEVDSLTAQLNDIDLWNLMIDLLAQETLARQTFSIIFGGTVGGVGGILIAPSPTGCQPGYETCAPGYRP